MISTDMMKDAYASLESQVKATAKATNNKEIEKSEKNYSGDKTRLNLKLPSQMVEDWKSLSEKSGLSLTKVIMIAMQNLQRDIEKEMIELNPSGAIYK